jgi:uncharacterized protein YndB with AHSA1/START domain
MAHATRVSLDTPTEIVTTRLLDAPVALVWRAFTESDQVVQWWGPVGFSTTTREMDVRTGGRWLHTMHGPDGRDYPNRIVYTNVVPQELLAWAHDAGGDGPPLFHARVQFQALGERTLVTLTHMFPSGAARDENIATYGSVQGAIDTTNRLAAHLVVMPTERDFVISREYEAPRALVWQAFTEAKHLSRWWGPAVFRLSHCEVEPRVGGSYSMTMTGPYPGPDDSDYAVDGVFLEIVAPERFVVTQNCARHPAWWHDAVKPGRGPDEPNPAGTMLQSVTLEAPTAARTKVTIRTTMPSPDLLASMKRIGMNEGWSESLGRLGRELQAMTAS